MIRRGAIWKLMVVPAVVLAVSVFSGRAAAHGDASEGVTRIELPREAGEGPDKEVSVLVDASHLKLAVLTLRRGTVLPPHTAPVPTTIQVLQGAGVIHVDSEAVEVSEGALVLLQAGAPHDVVPAEGSDMVLLVHYLRGGGPEPLSGDHH